MVFTYIVYPILYVLIICMYVIMCYVIFWVCTYVCEQFIAVVMKFLCIYAYSLKKTCLFWRNQENYDYHCSLLSGVLAEADSVTYGLNYRSALNELDDFHVCGQLPQDVMHILLEGVIPYTMKAILQSFVCV